MIGPNGARHRLFLAYYRNCAGLFVEYLLWIRYNSSVNCIFVDIRLKRTRVFDAEQMNRSPMPCDGGIYGTNQ